MSIALREASSFSREHDNLDDIGRKLDVSEAADAEDSDAGQTGSLHRAHDGFDAFADEQGRAGLNIVGQKDDAALVGAEGAALIFFVDLGLAFAVGGQIRELKATARQRRSPARSGPGISV